MTTGSQEKSGRVLICRLIIPLPADYPTYHGEVPAKFPDLHFEILSRMPSGTVVMEDIVARGERLPDDLLEVFRKARGVTDVAILEQSERAMMLRVTFDMSPGTTIYTGLKIPLRYPISFDNGVARMLVVAPEDKLRSFYAEFKKVAPDTSIAGIHQNAVAGPESLLTPKQEEVFRMAMGLGYWDAPRRINLTELADLRHVAKSTLAETLAQVEKKLLYELRDQHFSHWSL